MNPQSQHYPDTSNIPIAVPDNMDISPAVLKGTLEKFEHDFKMPIPTYLSGKLPVEVERIRQEILSEALRRESFTGEGHL